MDFLIRKILKEMSEQKGLSDKEVVLFKYLNSKYDDNKRKDKFFEDIRRGLKMFSLNPQETQYYFELFINNFREDGKYEDILASELKGPKEFKSKRTTNVGSNQFTRYKAPFKASNLEAYWSKDINNVDYYVVMSYRWYPIYLFKEGIWYKTIDSYSISTSKQISQSNPIKYDNRINQLVVLVTRDEMEKLRRNANLDDIIKHKKEELLKDKSRHIGTQKKIRNYPWEETAGDLFTPVKIKFKIKDIKEENNTAIIEVEILDVLKMAGNVSLPTPENYLKNEIPGITKEKIEKKVESQIRSDYRKYFGSQDIDNPIKIRFIHSKK